MSKIDLEKIREEITKKITTELLKPLEKRVEAAIEKYKKFEEDRVQAAIDAVMGRAARKGSGQSRKCSVCGLLKAKDNGELKEGHSQADHKAWKAKKEK